MANCPINEQTADGATVGRCCFHLADGHTCPRHGDVGPEVTQFEEGGRLVLENDMRRRQGRPLLGAKSELVRLIDEQISAAADEVGGPLQFALESGYEPGAVELFERLKMAGRRLREISRLISEHKRSGAGEIVSDAVRRITENRE